MKKTKILVPVYNDWQSAFKLLEENGIQKVSFNMLGLPYEKLEDIFKTIAMNKLCNTDVQSLGTFYPYQGTPIRRMLKEKKMLNEDNEKALLQGYDFNTNALTVGRNSSNIANAASNLVVNTLVFPEPAPATIKFGPSVLNTASFCSLFKFSINLFIESIFVSIIYILLY